MAGALALAILSTLSPDELASAIVHGDKAMIGRANGVGPKLAMRIANELAGQARSARPWRRRARPRRAATPPRDAMSALANLGFKPAEASAAVAARSEELGDAQRSTRWSAWR